VGRVVDEDGVPVADAHVSVTLADPHPDEMASAAARSGQDGSWSLDDALRPGGRLVSRRLWLREPRQILVTLARSEGVRLRVDVDGLPVGREAKIRLGTAAR